MHVLKLQAESYFAVWVIVKNLAMKIEGWSFIHSSQKGLKLRGMTSEKVLDAILRLIGENGKLKMNDKEKAQ